MNITKDAMSKNLVTINSKDTMVQAYRLMMENNIRHLPVLDERDIVVGILSDRDIQRAMNVKKINNFQQNIQLSGELFVENFMNWPVYTVSESTTLMHVAGEMLEQKVSAFLVEDEHSKIKGIVTTDDILKVFIKGEKSEESIGLKSVGFFFSGPTL